MSSPVERAFPAIRDYLVYDADTGNFTWIKPVTALGGVKVGDRAGSLSKSGYVVIGFKGRKYLAHRLAWHWVHGETPDLIDHINNRRADNRIANLRPASKHQNAGNQRGRTPLGKGVRLLQDCRRFAASIRVHGKSIHLGTFRSLPEARAAYAVAALEHFGEFARTE